MHSFFVTYYYAINNECIKRENIYILHCLKQKLVNQKKIRNQMIFWENVILVPAGHKPKNYRRSKKITKHYFNKLFNQTAL